MGKPSSLILNFQAGGIVYSEQRIRKLKLRGEKHE
jgi:hypothetical protein